jgi:hypothetical protein
MDLYKWAAKLLPLLDSDIVMDAFELAYAARVLDMRASPYDLSALGLEPVRIETPSGRAEYVREQAVVAERAGIVRRGWWQGAGRCSTLRVWTSGSYFTWWGTPLSITSVMRRGASPNREVRAIRLGIRTCLRPFCTASTTSSATFSRRTSTARRIR